VVSLRGLHILLVEDDAHFARSTALFLQKAAGAVVDVEASVDQAMNRLSTQPVPDMVLTNQELHGQATGTDLAKWMQAQSHLQKTLRILFSAQESQAILKHTSQELFHAVLDKTRPILQLVEQLGDLVEHRGA